MIEFNGRVYTQEEVQVMRDWVSECSWGENFEPDEIQEMDAIIIVRGVNRHFDGGLAEFMRVSFPACVNCGEYGCDCYRTDDTKD